MTNMIKIQQGLSSSSLRIEEESNIVMMQKKHGTVTILGSNCDDTNTLSAEELMPHSISKGIADSLSSSSSEDEAEAERERLEIWSSIQRNKKEEQKKAGPGAFDMWNSLMSLKDNNEISKSLPVSPYIHPLVKRTKSCLSEKSLEICTENLGSETGSDGLLSSYPSETEEEKEEHHQQQQQVQEKEEKLTIEETKYNFGGSAAAIKKYYPSYRSFPPPLSSLSSSLHMRTHRGNGRLVLEAVSAPSNNNFCVQRQDGRLVLTLANHEEEAKEDATADDEVSEVEEEFGEFLDEEGEAEDESGEIEEVGEIESGVKDDKSIMLEKVPLVSSEITINGVHRLAMVMNKPIGLVNRNQEWSSKFNEVDVNVMEVEKSPVAKSLPPRPRVARLIPSTNFNAYEYYWKTKPTTTTAQGDTTKLLNSLPYNEKLNNNSSTLVNNNSTSKVIFSGDIKHMSNDQKQQLMVVREKNGDYKLVCNLDNSCKDSRRSLLFWEPYCIATS
ncbi:PREDICTED: protein FAF-like, chloroplastic isoform X4 [Lupinus angustifolius]|uniref:protein FAF-like, chloroplastic isoform X4 n=1 Tax=Lupinus angustifolius TaxID=3871 RepID=UPI00092F906A|nr:PREDICTED: protein FAF-like, chloroplastic isoform X4 [Lupinus angustifolius]